MTNVIVVQNFFIMRAANFKRWIKLGKKVGLFSQLYTDEQSQWKIWKKQEWEVQNTTKSRKVL